MERERKVSWSWWVGVLAIVLTLPAIVVFIERDSLSSSSSDRTDAQTLPAPFPGAGPDGVVEVGAGTCIVAPDAIRIEGSGMTACRAPEWTTRSYLDQRLSVDAVGIDAGATIVFRFRESEGRRIEVAIGRTAVVIREMNANSWALLASAPRQTQTGDSIPMTTLPLAAVHRLTIDLSGDLVSVAIDGSEITRGRTSIGDPGLFSVGAITSDTVAVRLYSISVTDVS